MNEYDHALNLFTDYTMYENYTDRPFRQGIYTYATDKISMIQVRSDLTKEDYEELDKPNAEAIMDKKPNRNKVYTLGGLKAVLNRIPKVNYEECSACEGNGKVEFEFEYDGETYYHSADCPVCHGTGEKELDFGRRDFRYGVKFEPDAWPVKRKHLTKLIQTMDLLGISSARLVYADLCTFKFELDKDIAIIVVGYHPKQEFEDFYICYGEEGCLLKRDKEEKK